MDNKWLCHTDCFMLARSVLEVTQTHIHMRVCGVAVWSLVVRVLDLGIPGEAPRDHASASQRSARAPGEKVRVLVTVLLMMRKLMTLDCRQMGFPPNPTAAAAIVAAACRLHRLHADIESRAAAATAAVVRARAPSVRSGCTQLRTWPGTWRMERVPCTLGRSGNCAWRGEHGKRGRTQMAG